jgi:hypothetical protein
VKSGIFSATVAQNPTIPVSDGMKNRMNSAVVWNLLSPFSTTPRPPALLVTHHSSSNPTASRNGAPRFSSMRMLSTPFQTTHILINQKAKKQIQIPDVICAVAGHTIFNIE